MNKHERRTCWYCSSLIVIALNSPKLLALRAQGFMSAFWQFNMGELLFQAAFNAFFCWVLLERNLNMSSALAKLREERKYVPYVSFNLLLFAACVLVGGFIQRNAFNNTQDPELYWTWYLIRMTITLIMCGILIRVMILLRASRRQSIENERLKTAYVAAELELLKGQMNPHFLFNSLSSLSAVIRESPELAQRYVHHMSKVIRYILQRPDSNLVTLEDELAMMASFGQLLSMRYEEGFQLDVRVDPAHRYMQLPHLTLQPLLENAAKHNAATVAAPLRVEVYVADGQLIVRNNLQPVPAESNGIGLVNLNERYRKLLHNEIAIERTNDYFAVKLPLQHG